MMVVTPVFFGGLLCFWLPFKLFVQDINNAAVHVQGDMTLEEFCFRIQQVTEESLTPREFLFLEFMSRQQITDGVVVQL
jgi:hypothetical protein